MSAIPAGSDPLAQAGASLSRGDFSAAEIWALQVIEEEPGQSRGWCALGQALKQQGRLGEAVEVYLRAASIDGKDVTSRNALGDLFSKMSLTQEAIHWFGEAVALEPDNLVLQLNHCFVLPVVATSRGQIEQLRQRSLEGLQALEQRRFPLLKGNQNLIHHPYYLLYHNHNDRDVLVSYSRLLGRHLIDPCPPPAPPLPGRPRRRIGFLSGYFHLHSNSLAFEGLIRHLDRRRFEVVVIHLASSRCDAMRERIDACADAAVVLENELKRALQQLAALKLDILYFTDIGMHAFPSLLACRRSAPLQVTGWGVPQTSGMATIDHYISATLLEPAGAEDHYSENLVRLPGLPSCYLAENLPAVIHDRDYFFLPQETILIGCLQTLWKLHPDFDAILERIALRLPDAWFVIVEAEITSYTQIFLERIEHSAPTLRQRLIVLSRMNRQEFISLAACLDLLLDPPYFSSGVSLYDTLHTGTPTICMQGTYLRSRYAAGAYRLIGVSDAPIAHDPDQYVELVVRLAEDPQRLSTLKADIRLRATAQLYDRLDGVEAFADFVEGAIERVSREQGVGA